MSLKKAYAEGRMSKGESHWNWKGGITSTKKKIFRSLEYKLWGIEVFERDNYTCICGFKGNKGYITAHHIKSWAKHKKLRYKLDNGLTLCEDCHKLTDNYKGKGKKNECLVFEQKSN